MEKYIYDTKGLNLIRIEKAEPVCGDYCDSCGDCLKCYEDMKCPETKDGNHFWVQYEEINE